MRVGIVSDTHSRYHTVEKTLTLLAEENVEAVLHCGDIEDAETVKLLAAFPTHFVFGNCDGDRDELRKTMKDVGATCHEPFGSLEFGRFQVAWIHGDDQRLFRDLEASGAYDLLFYGHSHQAEAHRTGPMRIVNPGALHRARVKSFVILDSKSGELKTVVVA
jgi:putative phosphoesterase